MGSTIVLYKTDFDSYVLYKTNIYIFKNNDLLFNFHNVMLTFSR